jgi:SAM-dependent methyltransferase
MVTSIGHLPMNGPTTPAFRSLLYREPRLYDLIFPDTDAPAARMVSTAIDRWLPARPRSMLDVGCGSGQLLQALAPSIPECHGVDLLESNIAYARATRPGITFVVGDMRSVRLGRTFDLVTCLGNALSYALSDDALTETMRTFAAHAHAGTLLIVDPLNAHAYLEGRGFEPRIEGQVDAPGFKATSVSVHELDRQARVLKRVRTWHIAGQADVEDRAEYRLLLPDEMRRLLETAGFDVLGLYDNRGFQPSDLTGNIAPGADVGGMRGRKLYVFALRRIADAVTQ